jgi:hypothetical protein
MIYVHSVFWLLVIIFAVIGAFRGASKELLVTAALILFLFINYLLEGNLFQSIMSMEDAVAGAKVLFWTRTVLLTGLTLAGYQIPDSKSKFKDRIAGSDRVDKISGFLMGGINGYLIWGSLWFFMAQAVEKAPDFLKFFLPVDTTNVLGTGPTILDFLPPDRLQGGWLYAVVIFMFIFILVIVI